MAIFNSYVTNYQRVLKLVLWRFEGEGPVLLHGGSLGRDHQPQQNLQHAAELRRREITGKPGKIPEIPRKLSQIHEKSHSNP